MSEVTCSSSIKNVLPYIQGGCHVLHLLLLWHMHARSIMCTPNALRRSSTVLGDLKCTDDGKGMRTHARYLRAPNTSHTRTLCGTTVYVGESKEPCEVWPRATLHLSATLRVRTARTSVCLCVSCVLTCGPCATCRDAHHWVGRDLP